MSKPTKDCTHNDLFVCSLCWNGDDYPPSSTMSMETAQRLSGIYKDPTSDAPGVRTATAICALKHKLPPNA